MGKSLQLPKLYAQDIDKLTIDVTLSENPLGCSPAVSEALSRLSPSDLVQYPDLSPLRSALAAQYAVSPDVVVIGTGTEQLIKLIAQTFLCRGKRAFVQNGSFVVFTKECKLAGAFVRGVDPSDIRRIPTNADLIILCTPNNPTGEIIPLDQIMKILTRVPSCPVIIDEANADFTDETMMPSVQTDERIIILRTFSKAFGLAGLRCGFAVGSTRFMKQVALAQQAFPISGVAVRLALAAMRDRDFVEKTRRFMRIERTFLRNELMKRNCIVSASVTNTLFVQVPQQKDIVQRLVQEGVSVVDGSFFPCITQQGFRIALRDKRTNRAFLRAFDSALSCKTNKILLRSKELL